MYIFQGMGTGAEASINLPQSVPKALAAAHIYACNKLGLGKYSLGFSHLLAAWKLRDATKSCYDVENIDLHISFTSTPGETIFCCTSLALSFCLQKINMILFKVSSDIRKRRLEHIASDLQQASVLLQEFIPQMSLMYDGLDEEFYVKEYRHYLMGFNNAKLFPEGVLFEGTGLPRVKSDGASGGNDASVQIFERFLGISFGGNHGHLQQDLSFGFPKKHLDCVRSLEQSHVIRNFLVEDPSATEQMKESYDQLVEIFAVFFDRHFGYVRHFIANPLKLTIPEVYGTGGINGVDLQTKSGLIRNFKVRGSNVIVGTKTQQGSEVLPSRPRGCPFGFS